MIITRDEFMTTERNPENTRQKILIAAFAEIHRHGFQGMRVDQVLSQTGLKKGALYHHFPSKQALGYAVLEELVIRRIEALWIEPLGQFTDPLDGIHQLFTRLGKLWDDEFFNLGCPLNNLAQEMSPLDDGFRERIQHFFQSWQQAVASALRIGQQQGIVSASVNANDCAIFIIASMEGALGMAKNQQNKRVYLQCVKQLKRYLDTLKAGGAAD